MPLSLTDKLLLARAVELSATALALGNRPFGSVLGDAQGNILAEGQNDECTSADPTGHAEMNIIRRIAGLKPAQLKNATIYASGEPCAMCAAAIFWSGIRRVVFAASGQYFADLEGPSATLLPLPCAELMRHGSHTIEVIGPVADTGAETVLQQAFSNQK